MFVNLNKAGQLLKAAREEKGVSLDEIAKVLFIRKGLVEAIELGNWSILPHDLYVKGFVVQYASFLNVLNIVLPEIDLREDPVHHKEKKGSEKSGARREVIKSGKKRIRSGLSVVVSLLNMRIF